MEQWDWSERVGNNSWTYMVKMDSLRFISRMGDDCMLAASLCRSVWVRSEA